MTLKSPLMLFSTADCFHQGHHSINNKKKGRGGGGGGPGGRPEGEGREKGPHGERHACERRGSRQRGAASPPEAEEAGATYLDSAEPVLAVQAAVG